MNAVLGVSLVIFFGGFLLLSLGCRLLLGSSLGLYIGIAQIVSAIAAVLYAVAIRGRSRVRAGLLLLDLQEKMPHWGYVAAASVFALGAWAGSRSDTGLYPVARNVSVGLSLYIFVLGIGCVLLRNAEIRERGVILQGRLYHWDEIGTEEFDAASRRLTLYRKGRRVKLGVILLPETLSDEARNLLANQRKQG